MGGSPEQRTLEFGKRDQEGSCVLREGHIQEHPYVTCHRSFSRDPVGVGDDEI